MSESGIRALTLPVIFEHAHTGAGTFYHYFKDREDLLDAVYAHCFDLAIEELSDKDDPDATTRERFNCFCRNMFHAYRVYPREFNFLYWYTFGYVEPDVNCCRVIPSVCCSRASSTAGRKRASWRARRRRRCSRAWCAAWRRACTGATSVTRTT